MIGDILLWREVIKIMNKSGMEPVDICKTIEDFLDSKKAQDIKIVDLSGKSSMADYMVIATGSSSRQIKTMADQLKEYLYKLNVRPVVMEGTGSCDWVLVDSGDVIVHLFKPEVRDFYALEKMWGVDLADFARKVSEQGNAL